ncbi:hypothetical protein [Leeuwenhoekiella sp. H156]|uniref:hypothetical protein n=1 Tax=Leeuwenhoekiella sp. H156 TaxID=3450128 RepID=UPI003FA48D06
MGFSTHFEVALRTKSYIKTFQTHDISDIDVFGYRFNSDLSFFTIGSECKSGDTGALEELFKFVGIVDYYNLDRGYLIKSRIHQNAREVALKNKIRCITESEIRQILLGQDFDIDRQLRVENAKYLKYINALKDFKKADEKLVEYISLDYWNREDWKNIHNLLHILNFPKQSELFDKKAITVNEKIIFYRVAELFSIAVLKIISDAMMLNFSDISKSITNMLYGGAESLNEKRKIHDLVSQATKSDAEFEPNWQGEFLNMSFRFSQHTYASAQIPALLQLILSECFYSNKVKIETKHVEKFPDLTRKYTQDIMQFLANNSNLNPEIFKDFMII